MHPFRNRIKQETTQSVLAGSAYQFLDSVIRKKIAVALIPVTFQGQLSGEAQYGWSRSLCLNTLSAASVLLCEAESASQTLPAAIEVIRMTASRGVETNGLLDRWTNRNEMAKAYTSAVQRYAASISTVEDIRVAPFRLMASEGSVHAAKPHEWHMTMAHRIAEHGGEMLISTPFRRIDLSDDAQCEALFEWWEELTTAGGEGVVVKPEVYVAEDGRSRLQPAPKCRGPEYLRIIYGPEYSTPPNLDRLRKSRRLGRERALAIREFGLGIEALERFVRTEPLRRVHECVAGVLALESQPVDPRL